MVDKNAQVEVAVRGLRKHFNGLQVLDGVDLEVHRHEVVVLIGPSGSGKSTLLRCLNLLELPDDGEILWEGIPVDYRQMRPAEVARHRAQMGMVFQLFDLFPHRKVLDNVIEGPVTVCRTPRAEAIEAGMSLLERVGMADKADSWPSELSGGQKQRVAIARALAMHPQVLLLDEVTSALDVEMISGINTLLADLAHGGMTMVVVTHDLTFARNAGDRICFLDSGRIVETGTPEELLDDASSQRVQQFLENFEMVTAP